MHGNYLGPSIAAAGLDPANLPVADKTKMNFGSGGNMLSFLVDDYLAENEMFGAKSVLLSSSSSKTAFGLAHLLHRRKSIKVVGLTSASNADFVRSLGCYDEVVTYDKVTSLPANSPVAYVDMSHKAVGRYWF